MIATANRQSGVVFFFWIMVLSGLALFAMVLSSAIVLDESSAESRSHEEGSTTGPRLLPKEGALAVPTFELENAAGGALSRDDLLGSVWIVDLIFTNCTAQCSTMTDSMGRLQEALADARDVRLVSISVDPKNDTAEVLRAYGERHGADPARWSFLRGEDPVVRSLAVEGFKLGAMEDLLLHSSRFVLVDRDGRIRGWYDGMSSTEMEHLVEHVRVLLEEPRS